MTDKPVDLDELIQGLKDGWTLPGVMALHLALELQQARERLAAVESWTHEYGSALVPSGQDTFGEGVRACKKQVAALLNGEERETPRARLGRWLAADENRSWYVRDTENGCGAILRWSNDAKVIGYGPDEDAAIAAALKALEER